MIDENTLLVKFKQRAVDTFDARWVASRLLNPKHDGKIINKLLLEGLFAWTLAPQLKSLRAACMNKAIFNRIYSMSTDAQNKKPPGPDFKQVVVRYLPHLEVLGRFFPKSVKSHTEISAKLEEKNRCALRILPLIGMMQIHARLIKAHPLDDRFSSVSFSKAKEAAEALMSKENGTYENCELLEKIPMLLRPKSNKYLKISWSDYRESAAYIAAFYCWGRRHRKENNDITELFDTLRESEHLIKDFGEIVGLAKYFDSEVLNGPLSNVSLSPGINIPRRTAYPTQIEPIECMIYDIDLGLMELLKLQFVDNRKAK